ncbi:hypothetical protein BASA50_006433 [Batrachochytrium salamandrivorans]|uniref:BZIP domain-containing protein n=1 Tax=Batrachochytrium salamandrivorans TaxID=1357716 RepID=A0ABQ8FDE9_9FUNG|nr:hypothetical protein BASA50_006433 [Batrachochytrium salamandrivorans]KAJ1332845.1 hypothetical protein BSLG_008472 [Batrachochytrium salamandrivorans]
MGQNQTNLAVRSDIETGRPESPHAVRVCIPQIAINQHSDPTSFSSLAPPPSSSYHSVSQDVVPRVIRNLPSPSSLAFRQQQLALSQVPNYSSQTQPAPPSEFKQQSYHYPVPDEPILRVGTWDTIPPTEVSVDELVSRTAALSLAGKDILSSSATSTKTSTMGTPFKLPQAQPMRLFGNNYISSNNAINNIPPPFRAKGIDDVNISQWKPPQSIQSTTLGQKAVGQVPSTQPTSTPSLVLKGPVTATRENSDDGKVTHQTANTPVKVCHTHGQSRDLPTYTNKSRPGILYKDNSNDTKMPSSADGNLDEEEDSDYSLEYDGMPESTRSDVGMGLLLKVPFEDFSDYGNVVVSCSPQKRETETSTPNSNSNALPNQPGVNLSKERHHSFSLKRGFMAYSKLISQNGDEQKSTPKKLGNMLPSETPTGLAIGSFVKPCDGNASIIQAAQSQTFVPPNPVNNNVTHPSNIFASLVHPGTALPKNGTPVCGKPPQPPQPMPLQPPLDPVYKNGPETSAPRSFFGRFQTPTAVSASTPTSISKPDQDNTKVPSQPLAPNTSRIFTWPSKMSMRPSCGATSGNDKRTDVTSGTPFLNAPPPFQPDVSSLNHEKFTFKSPMPCSSEKLKGDTHGKDFVSNALSGMDFKIPKFSSAKSDIVFGSSEKNDYTTTDKREMKRIPIRGTLQKPPMVPSQVNSTNLSPNTLSKNSASTVTSVPSVASVPRDSKTLAQILSVPSQPKTPAQMLSVPKSSKEISENPKLPNSKTREDRTSTLASPNTSKLIHLSSSKFQAHRVSLANKSTHPLVDSVKTAAVTPAKSQPAAIAPAATHSIAAPGRATPKNGNVVKTPQAATKNTAKKSSTAVLQKSSGPAAPKAVVKQPVTPGAQPEESLSTTTLKKESEETSKEQEERRKKYRRYLRRVSRKYNEAMQKGLNVCDHCEYVACFRKKTKSNKLPKQGIDAIKSEANVVTVKT